MRFLRMWPFFNPTIKVVTFRLRGCLLYWLWLVYHGSQPCGPQLRRMIQVFFPGVNAAAGQPPAAGECGTGETACTWCLLHTPTAVRMVSCCVLSEIVQVFVRSVVGCLHSWVCACMHLCGCIHMSGYLGVKCNVCVCVCVFVCVCVCVCVFLLSFLNSTSIHYSWL